MGVPMDSGIDAILRSFAKLRSRYQRPESFGLGGLLSLTVILRPLLVLGCIVALLSVGGLGVYLSPLLVPLLFVASRTSRSIPAKVMWACLAALAAAEGTWGLAYALLGEAKPSIWLLPAVVGALLGLNVFKAGGQHMVMMTVQRGE